jgi:glycosyltransferase involved in cell wall biosynthesis
MSDVRLTIIVATTGRSTLVDALASATVQMLPGDELIVVFDDSGDAGDTPRNRVLDSATGTHITFLDDDDRYEPGALEAIRDFARIHPERIGIFRITYGLWGTFWRADEKDLMHTATAMYVVPNIAGKVGRFGRVPGVPAGRVGDYRFIVETVALLGEPVWCETITQQIRPETSALKRLRYRMRLRTRLKRAAGLQVSGPVRPVRVYADAERWARELLAAAGLDPGLAAPTRP